MATFRLQTAHLRVFSSLFTNIAAGLILTLPTSLGDPLVLTGNILFGIVCVVLAIWFERIVEHYD